MLSELGLLQLQATLLVEAQGKRLTALPSASREDVTAAVMRLPEIQRVGQGNSVSRKLAVEEWNDQPVTTSGGKALLEAAGFVRDYQSMALYASGQ